MEISLVVFFLPFRNSYFCHSSSAMCRRSNKAVLRGGFSINGSNEVLLLFAGDCSSQGRDYEVALFLEWFAALPHRHKVMMHRFFSNNFIHILNLLMMT